MYLSPFIAINSFVAGFMEGEGAGRLDGREDIGEEEEEGEIRGFPKWMQTLVINLITHTYIERGRDTQRAPSSPPPPTLLLLL